MTDEATSPYRVGQRTLVAVERDDGRYDYCHRPVDRAGPAASPRVRDPPEGTAVGPDGLLGTLDPRDHDWLVVVGERTERFAVLWLGLELLEVGAVAVDCGALVPADSRREERLHRWLRDAKDVLGDAVDAGLLPWPVAVEYLRARVAAHPDVPAQRVIWLPDRR